MAEEEAGTAQPGVFAPEGAVGGTGSPQAPGWYPTRANPSDQTYWDGQTWTARRRWTTGKGWVVAGDAPDGAAVTTSPPPSGPRLSGNPYAPMSATKQTATGVTFNVGILFQLVSGIALMFGSVGPWIHVDGSAGVVASHVSLSGSINGIDPAISTLIGLNGWVTFIGGILLVIFACFEMTSEELLLAAFTAVIAAVITVFAVYDMFRVVQKISQVPASAGVNVSVGWGLICVLSASVLALLIALVRLIQR